MGDINVTFKIFDPTTFAPDGRNLHDLEVGTVKLVKGETTRAVRHQNGDISVAGFVGRYRTSTNPWPATLGWDATRKIEWARFGRDDRSSRFNKLRGISFEPATFEKLAYKAYWEARA